VEQVVVVVVVVDVVVVVVVVVAVSLEQNLGMKFKTGKLRLTLTSDLHLIPSRKKEKNTLKKVFKTLFPYQIESQSY